MSSVGDYHPPSSPVDGPAEAIGGAGIGGIGRTYETMVFELDDKGEHVDMVERDSNGYHDRVAANRGHRAMCERWNRRGAKP